MKAVAGEGAEAAGGRGSLAPEVPMGGCFTLVSEPGSSQYCWGTWVWNSKFEYGYCVSALEPLGTTLTAGAIQTEERDIKVWGV